METHTYKIAVLSDLKDNTMTTLKSAVGLAKMVNGTIDFFHVKKPTDIVEIDNQLSAMRTINENYTTIENKMRSISESISDEYGMAINNGFTFGNIKNEISNFLKEVQPDVVVLGKRKSKMLNFAGDSITEFVLNTFDGVVMIASERNVLEPNMELSLGVLNSVEPSVNLDFTNDLMVHSKKPLKSFKIIDSSTAFSETTSSGKNKTIEYVFDQRDNAIKNLSKYLTKSKINLLCIDRERKNDADSNLYRTDIKKVINNLNVSLMFGSNKFSQKNI